MTYKYIRLGETKDSAGSTRAVYGFFDRAGRFRRRADIGQYAIPVDLGTSSGGALVTHERVEYSSRFRGLTHRQVRKEFHYQLGRKLCSQTADGEI
ncbi:hypothetical protein CTAM01_11607 [Colletotrichum tamarilloi]|uniref:Uncharacterized protein n=1 Tax=Colletotrichum tamarilloi TaxID=1209934 RepID=A0ABQ9QX75_9PEZI|nr:uncharacterized protein CTAM01_11607 [Colletotrichum tamarilloi]KAK1488061.1 hypothetical protein CTAM01_11607 [Colletotrichum tamarilloi]